MAAGPLVGGQIVYDFKTIKWERTCYRSLPGHYFGKATAWCELRLLDFRSHTCYLQRRRLRPAYLPQKLPVTPVDLSGRTTTTGRSFRPRRKPGKKSKLARENAKFIRQLTREILNSQNRMIRKGMRQLANEMVLCINEVADHKTTAREQRQKIRLDIRQHPGLKDLPFSKAVQQLLWIEKNL